MMQRTELGLKAQQEQGHREIGKHKDQTQTTAQRPIATGDPILPGAQWVF